MIKYIIAILLLAYAAVFLSFNLYSEERILFIDPITAVKGAIYHRGIRGWLLFYAMLFLVCIVIYIAYKTLYSKIEDEFNAPIKIKAEEIKALYKTNFSNIDNDAFKTKTYYVALNFKKDRTGIVIKDLLQKYSSYIPVQKFQMIEKLVDILEEFGDTSSVASYFGPKGDNKDIDDREFAYKANLITEDGLTSYDILKHVTLYNHTLNVLEEILKIVQLDNPKNYELLIADATIVALAHDIGKIRDFNVTTPFEVDGEVITKEFKLSGEVLNRYNHNLLSGIIFRNLWPILEDSSSNTLEVSKNSQEKIVEAIVGHHDSKGTSNNLLKYIIEADKNARKEEIRQFQINRIKNLGNSNVPKSDFQKVQDILKEENTPPKKHSNESIDNNEAEDDLPRRSSRKTNTVANEDSIDSLNEPKIIIQNNNDTNRDDDIKNINIEIIDDSENRLSLLNLSSTSSNKTSENTLNLKEIVEKKKEDKAVKEYVNKLEKEEEDRTITPIEFTIDKDKLNDLMAELHSNINVLPNDQKIKSLISISDGDTIYFAVTFIKKLILKYLWSDCSDDDLRGAAKYFIQYLYDKGLTSNMIRNNGMACMSIVGKNKTNSIKKFFCLPLSANKAFGIDKEELLQRKANSKLAATKITFYSE